MDTTKGRDKAQTTRTPRTGKKGISSAKSARSVLSVVTSLFLLPIAAFAVCLVLAGCQQVFDTSQETEVQTTGGKRTVIRIAAENDRTLKPVIPTEISKYVVTLTRQGSEDVAFTADNGAKKTAILGAGVDLEVEPGDWTITVDAYQFIGLREYKAASGSVAVTANEGLRAVKVWLAPIAIENAGPVPGVFSWNFTLPEGVEASADLGLNHLEGNSGSLELTPGVYDLSIVLTRTSTGQTTGIYEAAHIYPGLKTSANYNFSAEEGAFLFANNIPIAGTLNFIRGGSADIPASYTVQAYYDPACTDAIAGVTASLSSSGTSGSEPFVLHINEAQYTDAKLVSKIVYFKAGFAVSGYEYEAVSRPVACADLGQGKAGVEVGIHIATVYYVRYNANAGAIQGVMSWSRHYYDVEQNLLRNLFERAGYIFSGWATSSDGNAVYADQESVSALTDTPDATVDLYAHWTPVIYTVRYHSNYGADTFTDRIHTYDTEQNLVSIASIFPRAGYTFTGWSTQTGSTVAYADQDTVVNLRNTQGAIFDLYAQWTANIYTVTYHANGGTVGPSTAEVTYGSSYTLAVPTKEGFSAFTGWWTSADGGIKLTGSNGASLTPWAIASNIDIYAGWGDPCVVIYEPNGGSVSPPTALVGSDASYTLAVPMRSGYTFGGWWSSNAWDGAIGANNGTGVQLTLPTGVSCAPWEGGDGATVYARWTASGNTINLAAPASGAGWTYDSASNVFTVLNGASVRVTGSTTANRVMAAPGAQVLITLDSAVINLSGASGVSPLDIGEGANVILLLSGASSLTAGPGAAGVRVAEGRPLLIDSAEYTHSASGTLTAQGGGGAGYGSGAGIGGSMGEAAGTITIAGGTVNATGGANGGNWGAAAGIGGGGGWEDQAYYGGRGYRGDIVISGGVVNAQGGEYGAGIGSGCFAEDDPGSVTITGGAVTATGGGFSAGIGGGYYANGGNIAITGGTVIVKGGRGGAGIGGGNLAPGGVTTISGGMVFAQAGQNFSGEPAAIGGGGGNGRTHPRGRAGDITISGGVVVAYEGIRSANPGPMSTGNQNITISGGTVIAGGWGIGWNDGLPTSITFPGNPVVLTGGLLQDDTPPGAFTGARLVGSSQVTFTFTGSGNVSTAGTITLYTNLSIPAGAKLTVPPGWTLNRNNFTVTGTVEE